MGKKRLRGKRKGKRKHTHTIQDKTKRAQSQVNKRLEFITAELLKAGTPGTGEAQPGSASSPQVKSLVLNDNVVNNSNHEQHADPNCWGNADEAVEDPPDWAGSADGSASDQQHSTSSE